MTRPALKPGDRVTRARKLDGAFQAAKWNQGVVAGIWFVDGEWWVAVDRLAGNTEETPAREWKSLDPVSALAWIA